MNKRRASNHFMNTFCGKKYFYIPFNYLEFSGCWNFDFLIILDFIETYILHHGTYQYIFQKPILIKICKNIEIQVFPGTNLDTDGIHYNICLEQWQNKDIDRENKDYGILMFYFLCNIRWRVNKWVLLNKTDIQKG